MKIITLSILKRTSIVRCCQSCIHSQPPSTGQHKIKKPNLHNVVAKEEKLDIKRTRNVGIIAHIDAGLSSDEDLQSAMIFCTIFQVRLQQLNECFFFLALPNQWATSTAVIQ